MSFNVWGGLGGWELHGGWRASWAVHVALPGCFSLACCAAWGCGSGFCVCSFVTPTQTTTTHNKPKWANTEATPTSHCSTTHRRKSTMQSYMQGPASLLSPCNSHPLKPPHTWKDILAAKHKYIIILKKHKYTHKQKKPEGPREKEREMDRQAGRQAQMK